MHTDFACLLFSHLRRRSHPDTVKRIITEAVAIEQEFLTGMRLDLNILNVKLIPVKCLQILFLSLSLA
ncbi:hypothetical protein K474DRAFT_1665296 [Panus rudis PR-1116 ss-1]|nr:hypothetical protein K474DRAFT_1665296 [Panus rudis PR-1116 ss-1]